MNTRIGEERAVSRAAIFSAAVLLMLAIPASVNAADLPRWCGQKLSTSGDGGPKAEVQVTLPGRLVQKSFTEWVWDRKANEDVEKKFLRWVLVLDYETPVLSDLLDGPPGKWTVTKEIQIFGSKTENFDQFRNKHVLVTGVLNTAVLVWHHTDVYFWESKTVSIGFVGCDGKR